MKINTLFFILFFGLFSTYTMFAQESELSKKEDIPLKADVFVGIDKFENTYYIENNTLFKTTEADQSIAFQDVLLGDIDRVDILNPNKIIVYYSLSNTVIILDNRMTEIKRQDFNRVSPFKNVSHAGTSKDQSLWIYNIDLNQLELYDYRYNKTIAQSLPIDEQILNIKNNFNYCYLQTAEEILIFNIYGSLVKEIFINDIKAFDLFKNKLIVHSQDELLIYNEDFELSNRIKFSTEAYKNFFYKDENLYLYDGKNISRYSIITKN